VVQGWERVGLAGMFALAIGWLFACGHALYHQVRPGDTLGAIAKKYGVSTQEIVRYNAIRNPDKLEVGQMLRIPPGKPQQIATATKSSPPAPVRPTTEQWDDERTPFSERKRSDGRSLFIWPVEGPITSKFGPRNGSFHDGVDIAAPLGTQVLVAADGKVIFSDVLRGYGNVVIVRHANGYLTVYAHNKVNLVKEGQNVRQGDSIAEVGQSGRTTGASLHFEVRKDNLARDPMRYLPQGARTVQKENSPRASVKESTPQ